jgi:Flp pilus assembly protein TadG
MRRSLELFRACHSGVASIEFALLGTVLLVLFAGAFDLVYMVSAKRDADRASTLIAHAMATCSDSSCMSALVNSYSPRQANALTRYPNASISLYMIQNQSGTIKPCSGTDTTLTDSKIIASAKSILRDNDVGSAVMLTTTYTSILPKVVLGYISATGATYTGRTVDVMGNIGAVC